MAGAIFSTANRLLGSRGEDGAMRPILSLVLLLLVLVGPPAAAKPKDSHAVNMPILIAPMTKAGRLIGYAYLNPVLMASSDAAALTIRDRTPFLQDAFLRDVNAASIQQQGSQNTIDIKALQGRFLADARRVVGASNVTAVRFSQIQIAWIVPGVGVTNQPPVSTSH
jgi:hypothetical protein